MQLEERGLDYDYSDYSEVHSTHYIPSHQQDYYDYGPVVVSPKPQMFGLMDDSSQAYQDENQGEVFYDYPYIPEAQVAKRGERIQ